jgi:hypothetical protein
MSDEWTEVGGFGCVISAERAERNWLPTGFLMAEGGFGIDQQPDAVVVVQNDRLRVAAVPSTRGHDEWSGLTEPGVSHRYAIVCDRAGATLEWFMAGKLLKKEVTVPDFGASILALGTMTETNIGPDKGSVSCHGRGASATWSGIRVKTAAR